MMLQLTLKVTDVQLKLITDQNIYLIIEYAICGRVSYMAQRYAVANFPAMPDLSLIHI